MNAGVLSCGLVDALVGVDRHSSIAAPVRTERLDGSSQDVLEELQGVLGGVGDDLDGHAGLDFDSIETRGVDPAFADHGGVDLISLITRKDVLTTLDLVAEKVVRDVFADRRPRELGTDLRRDDHRAGVGVEVHICRALVVVDRELLAIVEEKIRTVLILRFDVLTLDVGPNSNHGSSVRCRSRRESISIGLESPGKSSVRHHGV